MLSRKMRFAVMFSGITLFLAGTPDKSYALFDWLCPWANRNQNHVDHVHPAVFREARHRGAGGNSGSRSHWGTPGGGRDADELLLRASHVLPDGLHHGAGRERPTGAIGRSVLGLPGGSLPAGDDLDAAGDAATVHELSHRLQQPGLRSRAVRMRFRGMWLYPYNVWLHFRGMWLYAVGGSICAGHDRLSQRASSAQVVHRAAAGRVSAVQGPSAPIASSANYRGTPLASSPVAGGSSAVGAAPSAVWPGTSLGQPVRGVPDTSKNAALPWPETPKDSAPSATPRKHAPLVPVLNAPNDDQQPGRTMRQASYTQPAAPSSAPSAQASRHIGPEGWEPVR